MNTKPLIRKDLTIGIILLVVELSVAFSVNSDMLIFDNVAGSECSSTMNIDPGTLSGYVTDAAMHPIEGAKVKVYFHNTSRENYSDAAGYYHVTDIPICYCMKNATCSKEGYFPEWVLLAIYENTTHDFVLTPKGNWLYVGGSGPGNYTMIQDAIDNASEGDTVFVYNGTYYENLNIWKPLTIKGEAKNTTIIDGVIGGDVVSVQADGVTITEFSIQYHCTYPSSDIMIQANHTCISQIIMSSTSNWFGISLLSSHDTKIMENSISNKYVGISLNGSSTNNTITCNNILNSSYGMEIKSSSGNHIYHNNLVNNTINAYDNGTNTWNNTYPSGGNYWSDYSGIDNYHGPNQNIPGSDGIGDTPYDLPCEYAIDCYPFMEPNGWMNEPPDKPDKPSGETNGKINTEYTYTTKTVDVDGDQVYYFWDWGDGSTSSWLGPYNSGAIINTTHTWTVKSSSVKVKAKDIYGAEGPFSDPLLIIMPYSYNIPLQWFWERLFQRFPNAFPLLRYLMRY
ncbi:hypothetical protein AYK25_09650 [Thermoplasmatales archaeon SM1-50]|nr:MAG: hypothetical protein AYK25_09650 [Thermoplasmatales archaeon SM1-50]